MTKAFELFKESLEKISDEDFAKILDEMENKELKIEVPQGYEIDRENSTFEKIVFKKVEELPKRWGELKRIKGVYVDSDSRLCNSGYGATYETSKNIFPTIVILCSWCGVSMKDTISFTPSSSFIHCSILKDKFERDHFTVYVPIKKVIISPSYTSFLFTS